MPITEQDISRVAELAQLRLDEATVTDVTQVGRDARAQQHQRLRADEVSECDQRESFQALAPATAEGLYLVPRVIE